MIKLVAIGLWVCLVSLGSSYVMASMRSPEPEAKPAPTYFAGIDYKKTDPITVPIIVGNDIKGYILARFVYTIDGEIVGGLAVPPDPFLMDDAFKAIYSVEGFDFEHPERYDLKKLTDAIRASVNKRYDKEVVHEVLVQQFDYIAKKDVRKS